MKALLLTMLTLLFLIGCSSEDSSLSPTQPPIIEENEAIQAIESYNDDSPISDIEPGEPLCLTENFGWVRLSNPCGSPVRVSIGTQVTITVAAASELTVRVNAGWHQLTWRPNKQMPYTEPVAVVTCDTTEKAFNVSQGHRANAIN